MKTTRTIRREETVKVSVSKTQKVKCVYHSILHGSPALEYENGDKFWYHMGKLHRDIGPAAITSKGDFWYKHGKYHRLDGPAVQLKNGFSAWYENGLLHRLDGPAIINPKKGNEFWIEGIKQQ